MELKNGDCLEVMKTMGTDSVDLLFADLPYGQTSCKWDVPIDLGEFWKEANRVCKKDAPMVFTTTTKYGYNLINSNPKHFRFDMVWVKSRPAGFLQSKKQPLRKHEMVYVFYQKSAKVYGENIQKYHTHKFPDAPCDVKVDCHVYETKDKNYPSKIRQGCVYDPPIPNTMLNIRNENGKHSTQKPVALMEWFNPTMGSGSTGVACQNLKRKFIGIELDKEIYDKACERLSF
jgi:site-specific DNA-methyltransferase (adenine-specific)